MRGHIAAATRQKSTARRFVSILAVLEGTYSMLCTGETAVTTRPGRHGAYCRLIQWEIHDAPPASTTAPTAARRSALRGGPDARLVMPPRASSTRTVGVDSTCSRLVKSIRSAASISTNETPVSFPRHLGEQFPGRAAVGAYLGRELHEGRPRSQGGTEVRRAQHARGRRGPAGVSRIRCDGRCRLPGMEPALALTHDEPRRGCRGEDDHECYQPTDHDYSSTVDADGYSRYGDKCPQTRP